MFIIQMSILLKLKNQTLKKHWKTRKKAKDEKIRREKEINEKNKFDSNDFIKKDVKPKHKPEENQSLKHKIDNCSLNNPLNYNTLYKKVNATDKNSSPAILSKENSFNKRKRNVEEEKEAAKKRKIEQKNCRENSRYKN